MEVWVSLLLGLGALLLALVILMIRKYSFWKKRGVPYVPPVPLLGSLTLKGFGQNKQVYLMDMENCKKYGKIYGFYEGLAPSLMVAEPDLIRDITIKDFHIFPTRRELPLFDDFTKRMLSILEGEEWKRVRSKMSPAFSSGKMRKMAFLIKECAETSCKNFAEISETKKPYNVKKIFGAFTMDVIATTAFGTKLDSHHDPDNPFATNAKKIFSQDLTLGQIMMFVFPRLFNFLGFSFIDKDGLNFFSKITEKIIEERKKNPEVKRYDFLQLMLDEMNDELTNGNTSENTAFKGLTMGEIVSNSILFFIAGYESTASTLAHCVYQLALNTECRDRLEAEVDKVFSDPNFKLDYDSIKTMSYLNAVISETLRIFPPPSRIDRQALENYSLGDTGIVIPKGVIVQFPVHAIHHHPDYFPDPEKFDPERFLPENREKILPFTYMPFGNGPRNCLAERFALLEIKICLALVIRQFQFHRVPETQVPMEFLFNQGFLVGKHVTLLVEKRR